MWYNKNIEIKKKTDKITSKEKKEMLQEKTKKFIEELIGGKE